MDPYSPPTGTQQEASDSTQRTPAQVPTPLYKPRMGGACAGALLAPPTTDVTAAVTALRPLGARFKTSSRESEQNGTSLPR